VALARGSLVVLALAACAWFALGIEQARDTDRATALLSSQTPLSPATASRVGSLLASAGTLNPDSTIDLLRSRLASLQHDPSRAIEILQEVTRREPLNISAWLALAQAALDHDKRAVDLAVANIGRLDSQVK
jgi:predicted Zn-dependent protease